MAASKEKLRALRKKYGLGEFSKKKRIEALAALVELPVEQVEADIERPVDPDDVLEFPGDS